MEFLSEDPTYLAGGLGLLAVVFLIALRVSQQGKYLVWAGVALGMAGLVLVIERVWVTDNERIERVVEELRRAVLVSDVDGVFAHLTPDVEYVQGGHSLTGTFTKASIRATLSNTKFDFVRVSHLSTNAGSQSRRGSAEFRVVASGTTQSGMVSGAGTGAADFSLGFQETSPGVWKVNSIRSSRIPEDFGVPSQGGPRRGRGGRPRLPISSDVNDYLSVPP